NVEIDTIYDDLNSTDRPVDIVLKKYGAHQAGHTHHKRQSNATAEFSAAPLYKLNQFMDQGWNTELHHAHQKSQHPHAQHRDFYRPQNTAQKAPVTREREIGKARWQPTWIELNRKSGKVFLIQNFLAPPFN